MTFETLLALLEQRQAEADAAGKAWNDAFPRDPTWPMGLAPDAIRFSPEYRAHYNAYHTAAGRVRKVMQVMNKHFKRQYAAHVRAEIAAKRARRLAGVGQ